MKNKRIELINLKDITDGGNANSTLTGGHFCSSNYI